MTIGNTEIRVYTTLTLLFTILPGFNTTLCAQRVPQNGQFFDDGSFRSTQRTQTLKLLEEKRLKTGKQLSHHLDRKKSKVTLPPERGSEAKPNLASLYSECSRSVVSIAEVRNCEGCKQVHVTPLATGFMVTADGVLCANRHVVEELDSQSLLVASTMDGTSYPVVEVLASSQKDDSALLKIDGDGFTPIPLSKKNQVGTRIAVVSHPSAFVYSLSEGIVSRLAIQASRREMLISADFATGSSGAPVSDFAGNALGMVAYTADLNGQMTLRSCIPSQSLLELVEGSNITPVKAGPDPFATERECLKATFAKIKTLVKRRDLARAQFSREFQELNAVMVHTMKLCPNDPTSNQYSELLKFMEQSKAAKGK